MKYILLEDNKVKEIIPDFNPVFPGIPMEKRYPTAFIAQLIPVEDEVEVAQNWLYDPETGTFSAPPEPEPVELDEDPGLDDVDPDTGLTGWDEMAAAIMEGVNAV